MAETKSDLNLQGFYPEEMTISQVTNDNDSVFIEASVKSKDCKCPKCGLVSSHKHGTYIRKVQDLPILGKTTWLNVHAYEYQCDNPDCDVSTFVEDLDGFIRYYGRCTNRLEKFLCILALETSCESCAKISKELGIKTSGDTVIRMLIRRYESQPEAKCGSIVGVDDFALKKGQNYGTIIVDEETHKPVALLDGRDGNALRDWLKKNKQVKTITRDRANAYTKAIAEILPDCMQIADRFHLYQNLSDAIKKALQSEVPERVKVSMEANDESKSAESEAIKTPPEEDGGKKNRTGCA